MIEDYIVQIIFIPASILLISIGYFSKIGKISYIYGYRPENILKNPENWKIITSAFFKISLILQSLFIMVNIGILFIKIFLQIKYISIIDVVTYVYFILNILITIMYINIVDRKL